MEYKKCEHCGEEIHIRSKRCPFCNQTVKEVEPQEIKEDPIFEENTKNEYQEENDALKNNIYNESTNYEKNNMAAPPHINFEVGAEGQPKDYIYKAEVHHSLEYTAPLSNMAKVFISALCTLPIMGQMIGIFIGVFFSTYEDSDRRSFGRSLIFLSIFMFFLYLAYIRYAMNLLGTIDMNALQDLLKM